MWQAVFTCVNFYEFCFRYDEKTGTLSHSVKAKLFLGVSYGMLLYRTREVSGEKVALFSYVYIVRAVFQKYKLSIASTYNDKDGQVLLSKG